MTSIPEPNEWTFGRVARATLLLVFVALGFWLIYRFHHILFLLFTAVITGTVLRPVVDWLVRRRISRAVAVVLVYFVVIAAAIGFIVLLIPLISQQGRLIVNSLPQYYQVARQWMMNSPIGLVANLGQRLPATLPTQAPPQPTGEQALASVAQALSVVGSVVSMAFIAAVILLLAFQWTLTGPRVIHALLLLLPIEKRERTGELISAMENKVSAFLAGQGIVCLSIGVMAFISYTIIGLPNALALAVVAGVLEAVPMVGPLLGAIPAGIVALAIDPTKLLYMALSTFIIQQAENNLLVPRVMSKTVGVNPFVSILAIFGFSSFFGLAGALMAVPIAAMIQLLLDRFVFEEGPLDAAGAEGRDYASRLRYEAQDFAQGLRKQARVEKDGSDHTVGQIDQVMDEMEAIVADLDASLAQVRSSEAP